MNINYVKMRKIILVFAAIAFSAGAYAQTDSTSRRMFPPGTNNTNDGMNRDGDINNSQDNIQNDQVDKSYPDGVMMQNGKMMMVKEGRITILDHDMTMSNGTNVRSDGTYIKKDGSKIKMKDGQYMDLAGDIIPREYSK